MDGQLERWGWDAQWQMVFDDRTNVGQPARVTAQHRDRWIVQTGSGAESARMPKALDSGTVPTAGDWVVVRRGPQPSDPWSIEGVLPRRSAVRRGRAGGGSVRQVLAANVDRLWIVHGLDAPINARRLERYIAVGWDSGASPEVVLTKADLCADLSTSEEPVRAVAIGLPVHTVSTEDADRLARLRDTLTAGSTVALVGPSGAGKSTLVNRLAGEEVAATGDVRSGDRKGRHTTTSRELIQIHNGALLLDTPGLRELRIHIIDDGIERAFPEIDVLADSCRFRDCAHESEPGCAVLAALASGELPEDRLLSYRKLMAEMAWERRRNDPRARAEEVAEIKTAMKTLKHHHKYRDRG